MEEWEKRILNTIKIQKKASTGATVPAQAANAANTKKDADIINKSTVMSSTKNLPLKAPEQQCTKKIEQQKSFLEICNVRDIRVEQYAKQKPTAVKVAVPNIIGRYKIFDNVRAGRRKYNKDWTEIFSYHTIDEDKHIKIWQQNKVLNQNDLTVYLALRKLCDKEFKVVKNRYQILKMLNLNLNSGNNYYNIDDAIDRLFLTNFKIKYMDRYIYKSSLIQYERIDEKNENYIIKLSDALFALFTIDSWSELNFKQRLELGKNQWAQAFHLYLSVNECFKNGKWFSIEKDLYCKWGQQYTGKKAIRNFYSKFKERVIKPLIFINFIKHFEENYNKTAINLKW